MIKKGRNFGIIFYPNSITGLVKLLICQALGRYPFFMRFWREEAAEFSRPFPFPETRQKNGGALFISSGFRYIRDSII